MSKDPWNGAYSGEGKPYGPKDWFVWLLVIAVFTAVAVAIQ